MSQSCCSEDTQSRNINFQYFKALIERQILKSDLPTLGLSDDSFVFLRWTGVFGVRFGMVSGAVLEPFWNNPRSLTS